MLMLITSLMRVLLTRSFKPFIFRNTYSNNLDYDNLKNLGLYVHIPFCRKICDFCPYCKVIYNEQLATQYREALLTEIKLVAAGHKKKQVTSLYFGGGSPALMINDLKIIIDCIKNYYDITDGIGVELHPDDIDEKILTTIKQAGVSMVSIGVQSFNTDCLNNLGRTQFNATEKIQFAKAAGFDVIDVDLIFAIPGQNEETLRTDIETAFRHGATQISTYPFIDFTFVNNKYKPMSEKRKRQMLHNITEFTKLAEKQRTSVWTFAKKETKKYSSVTRDNFLGFGVSATTLLKNEFKINTFSISAYIQRIEKLQLPTSLTLNFTKRQRACYYLFWSAYSMCLNKTDFQDMFGVPLKKMFGIELWFCEKIGFISNENNSYYLTDKGAYYYHYIEQAYTTAYIDKTWNISRVQDFPEKIIL